MSVTMVKEDRGKQQWQVPEEPAALLADLFKIMGSDPLKNIHIILSQALVILGADLALFLPDNKSDEAVVKGDISLPETSVENISHYSATISEQLNRCDLTLVTKEDSDFPAKETGLNTLTGIGVKDKTRLVGTLWTGFSRPVELTPELNHLALCLAGAISFQQRLRNTKEINRVAAQVAHDLNNLLSGLVSYPELILMQLDNKSPLKEPISFIHDSGLQSARIIQDFLLMAKTPVPGDAARIKPSDAAAEFAHGREYSDLKECFPKIRFSIKIEPDLPEIQGLEGFIPKILIILLNTAAQNINQTIKGAGEVEASLAQTGTAPGNTARSGLLIRVEDTAPPLDPVHRKNLFEPFYTTKQMGYSGSGLELAAVQKLVCDHEGEIQAAQPRAGGNRITAFIPLPRT